MARGRYRINPAGYAFLLNEDPNTFSICEYAGNAAAAQAHMLGGASAEYVVDSRSGSRRIHTRVTTANTAAFFSERKWHALRNTLPRI